MKESVSSPTADNKRLCFPKKGPFSCPTVSPSICPPVSFSGVPAASEVGVRRDGKRGELLGGRKAASVCGQSSAEAMQGERQTETHTCPLLFPVPSALIG